MKQKKESQTSIDTSNKNIESIIADNPDIERLAHIVFQKKKDDFIYRFSILNNIAERTSYLNNEMVETRKNLGDEINRRIYEAVLITDVENPSYTLDMEYAKQQLKVLSGIKADYEVPYENMQKIDVSINDGVLSNQFAKFLESMPKENPLVSDNIIAIFNSKNPAAGLSLLVLIYHYEKEYYEFLKSKEIELSEEGEGEIQGAGLFKEFTTPRQVLALHFLLEELQVYKGTDRTQVARFIQFLTGKETGAKRIADTNIYSVLKYPFNKSDKKLKEDLTFVRSQFISLGLTNIIDKLDKKIKDIDKNLG